MALRFHHAAACLILACCGGFAAHSANAGPSVVSLADYGSNEHADPATVAHWRLHDRHAAEATALTTAVKLSPGWFRLAAGACGDGDDAAERDALAGPSEYTDSLAEAVYRTLLQATC
jgi:hypothetical protein